MLKKFFIAMLGSIAGVWIAIAIGFFCIMGLVGALMSSDDQAKPSLEKHTALWLDLNGAMPERYQPADIWQLLRDDTQDGDALIDVLDAVRQAANDSKIEGIYITSLAGKGSGAGLAAREEIISALREFKKSGKWIVAYGDYYGQADYMLAASAADSLMMNPCGNVDVHGMASRIPLFKELMDKLGVKMTITRVGTFKSAVEPFMGTEISPANRLQTQVMLDSMWNYASSAIARGRRVKAATVNMWADSIISTWTARQTLDASAVTSLAYQRQAEDVVRRMAGIDEDDDIRLITPSEYILTKKAVNSSKKHIAVLVAAGDIVDSGEGGIVAESMVPEILSLAEDDNVGALVLRVNSGGGSAFASEQIWEALEHFKKQGKPFYVSMGDYAASGGYYISCGADKIYADRTTLTGSIGVFGMIPDLSGLVTDKLGIHFSTVSTNPAATIVAPTGPLTPGQLDALQRSVDDIYDLFTSRVATGRGISQDSVKVIAEGRVWTGGSALRLGLVDKIGGLREAVRDIAKEADIDADRVVYYPEVETNAFTEMLRNARGQVQIGPASVDAGTLRMLRLLDYLRRMNRVQARMAPVEFY